MRNLFQPDALAEILQRINKLTPSSQRQWGKMDVAQMLAHCSSTLEVAIGKKNLPRLFIGRILAPFMKSNAYNDKPIPKNSPTDKSFIIADPKDFEKEKSRLISLVKEFANGGEGKVTTHPHSFFGRLTPVQWSQSTYKHLDHHLTQFGV